MHDEFFLNSKSFSFTKTDGAFDNGSCSRAFFALRACSFFVFSALFISFSFRGNELDITSKETKQNKNKTKRKTNRRGRGGETKMIGRAGKQLRPEYDEQKTRQTCSKTAHESGRIDMYRGVP